MNTQQNTTRLHALLIAIWALLSNIVLLLTPKATYEQGAITGIIVTLSALILGWIARLYMKEKKTDG